jgi:hypothetical protein
MSKLPITFALLCVAILCGCQPTVPSPKDPSRSVLAEEAMREADELAKAKESEAKAAAQRFKIEAMRIESEAQIDLAELTAAHDEVVEKAESEARSLREATAAAIKAAEERQGAWLSGLGQAAAIAQQTGIPGVATVGGLLAGVLGMFSASRAKRQATDAEARAAAEAQAKAQQAAIAARIVDAMDILKLKSPEVASAFRAHGKDLAEWIGPEGVAFINRTQHS